MKATQGIQPPSLACAVRDLLNAELLLGAALVKAVSRAAPREACCEVPDPCWLPRRLGTCSLELRPGGIATIRLLIENCDWTRRTFRVSGTGELADAMGFQPATLVLGPQEQGSIVVELKLPDTVHKSEELSGGVVLFGCNTHFLGVRVRVSDKAPACESEVLIEDCPDYVHHWYDHFYCVRGCQHADGKLAGD